MWESPFDKACRYLLKLDPAALLAWLLGIKLTEMIFNRWLDTRRLPYPGQPDRTCDTVAHVECLELAIIDKWKELAAGEPIASRRNDYAALAVVFAQAVKRHHVWRDALKEWNMIECEIVKEWEDNARRKQGVEWVLEVLRDKFGALPDDLPSHLQAIDDLALLSRLHLRAVHAGSLDEFRNQIPDGTQNGLAGDGH